MPIRTNRGRAAVYRRIWGWPLRSPRHLIVALVVLAVLVTSIGVVLPKVLGHRAPQPQAQAALGGDPDRSTTRPPPAGGTPSSSQQPTATRLASPLRTPTSAAPNSEALRVAKQWATAWVNHPDGVTTETWLSGLRPYTTEEYLPVMSSVNPANVPAAKLTGEPTAVPGKSYTTSVEVAVPTDGPKLSLSVVNTGSGWRVAQYEQAG